MQLQYSFDIAPYLGSSLDEASTLPPVVAYLESESTVEWIDVSRLTGGNVPVFARTVTRTCTID